MSFSKIIPFSDLTLSELYELLALRAEVFVVEQNCPYQDLDGKDQGSLHSSLFINDKLWAYCRIIPPGLAYPDSSIGRVLTCSKARGKGYGKKLMTLSINECWKRYPDNDILIMAQSYLVDFYHDFNFEVEKDEFLEDGIPHRWMRLKPNKKESIIK
jgi:ElaA protein